MQGGIGVPAEHPTLRSLGSLYFEPIWIFVRGDVAPGRLTGLAGKRNAVGAAGSGTRAVALPLLEDNGVTGETADLVEIDGNEAIDALRRSEEHTSELQSLMRISYAVFCLKNKKQHTTKETK